MACRALPPVSCRSINGRAGLTGRRIYVVCPCVVGGRGSGRDLLLGSGRDALVRVRVLAKHAARARAPAATLCESL
jgi:hypothetical protein